MSATKRHGVTTRDECFPPRILVGDKDSDIVQAHQLIFATCFVTRFILLSMNESEAKVQRSLSLTARQTALADIAERRRKDSNWSYQMDPTYTGPHPELLARMNEAEFESYVTCRRQELPWLNRALRPVYPDPVHKEGALPQVRACLPYGQRVRDIRRVLGLTQRELASQLGVSCRSIIRYEQGRSSPLKSAPLLALRRLESGHARELESLVDSND